MGSLILIYIIGKFGNICYICRKVMDGCSNNFRPIKKISIQDDKYFVDGKYWGRIIEKTDNYFKVKCDNGNRYMKGHIIKIILA